MADLIAKPTDIRFQDLTGRRFSRLLVLGYSGKQGVSSMWECICDCGNEHRARGESLKAALIRSCGCLAKETTSIAKYIHGGSASGKKTAEYRTWRSIKGRCLNKNNADYSMYGGRNITVCDRWKNSFVSFLADMGTRPSPSYSIDRIDNNGNYEPGNCRWATLKEQANNKRNTLMLSYKGETKSALEWSILTGISTSSIRTRIYRGWPIERVLTQKERNYSHIQLV